MERVISADGTPIGYARSGDGPPLVLVHGTGRDHSCWARVLPGLAQHATVYAVDRRGRGRSGDSERYSIEREVEDILAVIDAVGAPVNLLGHSYGAIVALEAASCTDQLQNLILYEPPFSMGSDQVPSDLGDRLDAMLASSDRESVLLAFLREGPRYTPEEIETQRARPEWRDRIAFAHTLPRETQSVGRYAFSRERVGALRVPTLLLLGSESPAFFRQTSEALHSILPRCDLVMLEKQRHNAMETEPGLFVETVHRFLARHVGGDTGYGRQVQGGIQA